MFGRPFKWDDYGRDILKFCGAIDATWSPSYEALCFLLEVQRGYRRVGLSRAPDAWKAAGVACLWRACCYPDHIQFVMAGTATSGQSWVRFLKNMAAGSSDRIREHLLFTQDDNAILVDQSDEPVLSVLSPSLLVGGAKIQGGRPTVLVMPDLDRVPSKWIPFLSGLVDESEDQWLCVAPCPSVV